MAETISNSEEARRRLAAPRPADTATRALTLAEAQVCATLHVGDQLAELVALLRTLGGER